MTLSKRKLFLSYGLWWLALVLLEAYITTNTFGFSVNIALADAVNINLLIITAWWIVFNGLKWYLPRASNGYFIIIWTLGLAIACEFGHTYLMSRLFRGNTEYLTFLENSHLIRGLITWLMISLVALLSWMWYYLKEQRDSEAREKDASRLAREAELSTLRQKLQPHFLFNSLNSISALAGSRPEEARKMIQQLSDFLRGTIKREDQQLVTLDEELTHLELYLDIEKVRFGHRLKTEVTKDEQAGLLKLPSLLLQPLVENAIKFGLYDTTGEITIRIQATADQGTLVITVENPFDKATAQPRQGTGFGLSGVQRRLYLLYARNDLLTAQASNDEQSIFRTQVKIPQA